MVEEKYIIINLSEVTAQLRNRLKNYQQREGFFIQDSINSVVRYTGIDGNTYVILSFINKPSVVPAKFREAAQDEKLRILSREQMYSVIKRFMVFPDLF